MLTEPQINQTISVDYGKYLCDNYGLYYLSERIYSNPGMYGPWVFDGVSGVNDKLLSLVLNKDDKILTYKCALPHDLAYAYGRLDDSEERKRVDGIFYNNLVNVAHISRPVAKVMYGVVRVFGSQKFNFSCSWGFAKCK